MAHHRERFRRALQAAPGAGGSKLWPLGGIGSRSRLRILVLSAAALDLVTASTALVTTNSHSRSVLAGNGSMESGLVHQNPGLLACAHHGSNPRSLSELLSATGERLAECDIARINLLCAQGLPGADKLDIEERLATLDRWAEKVRSETERHLYRVYDPRWAGHYRHSESYLRAEFLAQVLQEDCGVRYNYTRYLEPDFRNSKDLFIHGMIDCDNGGTCVSIPVLYVAVGRRLGYPLKLVLTKRHVFCRWDDGKGERINVDPSGNGGIGFEADDYYRTWPATISEEAVASGEYLKSLTPSEELAVFLEARGHCLHDNGRVAEACEAYAAACRLMPQSLDAKGFLEEAERELARLRARLPPRPDTRGLRAAVPGGP